MLQEEAKLIAEQLQISDLVAWTYSRQAGRASTLISP